MSLSARRIGPTRGPKKFQPLYYNYMTEITLRDGWSNQVDVDEFIRWADLIIGNDNWNFTSSNTIFSQRLIFAKEEDAIACKIKFGL